jgi:hypothetical protein
MLLTHDSKNRELAVEAAVRSLPADRQTQGRGTRCLQGHSCGPQGAARTVKVVRTLRPVLNYKGA